jgi:Raf kinase inhibitor-like YbhB/YbcL family protein
MRNASDHCPLRQETAARVAMNSRRLPAARACLAVCVLSLGPLAAASAGDGEFRINSTTFRDGGALPTSMADNFPVNGVNVCTADGSVGGNTSPELAWQNAPAGTRSFVVIAFDVTASFTHWGIYNIGASTTVLPAGAGTAVSSYGAQVNNDFPSHGYEGPCPPAGVVPFAHHYVFTVYALDTHLHLPLLTNFPQNAETLFNALAKAGADGHVLGSASVGGFFSATPAN